MILDTIMKRYIMSGIIFKIYQPRRFTSRIIMSVLCRSIDIIETISFNSFNSIKIRFIKEFEIKRIKG